VFDCMRSALTPVCMSTKLAKQVARVRRGVCVSVASKASMNGNKWYRDGVACPAKRSMNAGAGGDGGKPNKRMQATPHCGIPNDFESSRLWGRP